MGKIATAVIAKLRNDVFTSLAALNAGIRKAVKEFNDKPFQKRPGSRQSIFETEEKPYLRTLPLIPYEVCEWSYGHNVASNSHIGWNKGQYSVPYKYIGCKVDVKFNSHLVFIYYNRTEIARHQILPRHMANGMRTEQTHLPFPLRKNLSVDVLRERARETGPKTFEVIRRMFDKAKVKEQPMQTAGAILSIADIYSPEILEKACDKALRQFHLLHKKSGIVRGADYYRKGESTNEH